MEDKIVTIKAKKDEKFLRNKTREFDFKKFTKSEINDLINRMRKAMKLARGIGLSANQIGLDMKVFVAQAQKADKEGNIRSLTAGEQKFYAIFNPEIIKFSKEKTMLEEGCLSVPSTYADVERSEKITLVGFDKNGKKIKIKAWGILAKIFQHETDHLNGKIILDRASRVYKVSSIK